MKICYEKYDVVYGKVVCGAKNGCYVENEQGTVFFLNTPLRVGTFLYGSIEKLSGRYPTILLDSVC